MMNGLSDMGRIMVAMGFVAMGISCIGQQNFIIGRPPGWATEVNPLLANILGPMIIFCALLILIKKRGDVAAFAIAALILVFALPSHFMHFMDDWANVYKSIFLFGGAVITGVSLIDNATFTLSETVKRKVVFISSVLMTSFFIVSGYAHIKYADFVAMLIPSFIPFPVFWTYFCGVCLIAGGIGMLVPQTRKLASLLSAIMVFCWFLLLHLPRVIENPAEIGERLGLFESFTFVGMLFTLTSLIRVNEGTKTIAVEPRQSAY